MKNKKLMPLVTSKVYTLKPLALTVYLLLSLVFSTSLKATIKTSAATGMWSAPATWSPSGIPATGDTVVIHGGNVVTVDGTYTCRNLTLGDATGATTTLTVTVNNSLTISGDLQINPSNKANIYTFDAGAGTINVNGTFSTWSTTGTNNIKVGAGTLNFTPAVAITAATQNVTFTGAGTINFYNNFTDSYNKLVTFASCIANFYKNYTVNTTVASWAAKGTAKFKGNGYTITPTSNLTLYMVQFDSSTTLASSAGTVVVGGDVTISSGATFTANQNFEVDGNWANNGGTLSAGSNTISFNGNAKTFGGTASTTFPNVTIGATAVTVSYTMNTNNTFNNLTFHSTTTARTLTISATDTLTVNGDVTINQPTAAVTNQLAVNAGVCNVAGNLIFSGTDNTATFIGKVAVTTGAFTLTGNVTWMSNTAIATEVITCTGTGSISFANSLTMGSGSGTLSATSTGTINFNGTTAPSFTFGGATAPVFTTAAGSNIYFATGFTNNTNSVTFNATSNTYFSGSGTITPSAAITFGNVQFSASAHDTLASGSTTIIAGNLTLSSGSIFKANQDFEVDGNWTNNGGTLSAGSNTVTLNGATKTISGTTSTAFPNLQIGNTAVTVSYTMNNNNTCNNLTFQSINAARTLTLSVGDTLAVSGNLTINQGTSAVTNSLAVNAGVCTVAGNLVFSGTTNTTTWICKVAVTTGSFSVNGTVTWMSNTATATELISATTGSLIFGSSITMGSGSGKISVTGAGTIRFNGTTAPSLNFGGAATVPVFTTAAACNIYFAKGFTNNTNALTLNATSTAYFTGSGSITPNAALTFGHVYFNPSLNDTLAAGSGAVIIKGDVTISSGTTFLAGKDFQAEGNWSNNGGTFNGGTYTVTFNGLTKTIGGSSATTFYNLTMGSSAVILNYTASKNITCNNLVFHGTTKARTLTLSSGVTLTVNGNVTMNQPTGAVTNSLSVSAGTCNVSGNLVFAGASATTTRIAQIAVTTGSFTLNGTLTWMSNTVSATEIISVTSGSLTFANSIAMGSASGTINVTGAGTVNFNGTPAPSLSFGGATAPVFNSAYGSTINFVKGLTATTTTLTFATGSTQVFKGTATITPTAAITFGNFQINSTYTVTMAGNIAVTGNWTNNGTFTPSTYTVNFNGIGNQTIARTGSETFYGLTGTTFGTTIQMSNDVTVTNTLTMNGPTFNTNGYTLQLGSGSGAALSYTAGEVYGGTFKRYWPASAITSSSGNYYGLFPIGTMSDYRPVTITSTVSPTGAGYVSVTHTDLVTATNLTYTDNEGSVIQQIADKHSDISYSSVTGGTYSLDVKMTDMGSQGSISNLKMIYYDSGTPGSTGTHTTTTGALSSPTGHRTGISLANLAHHWVIGTNDRNSTPMYVYVYSRKSGNWNDASGTGTWSLTAGGSGAACSCVPTSSGYAVINPGHNVTVTATDTCKFLDIDSAGVLTINSAKTFNVNGSVDMYGTASFTNNGTLIVTNELLLSSATSPVVNGNVTATYFTMPTGTAYTQSSGTLTVSGELALSGAMGMASGASLVFSGNSGHLSGSGGTFTTASGGSFPMTNNKLIESGTSITIGTSGTNTALAIAAGTTVNNLGSIIVNGNITGANASTSIWINNANSALSVTGTLLTTGILDAATSPNTVEYSGSGAQTIIVPLTSYYDLKATNAGTKTMAADIVTDDAVILGGSVILDESTNALTGNAGLTMSGTSELKLSRATDNNQYPELNGTYSLTDGTVTLLQTGDSCTVHPAQYYNLKFTGSTPYDLSGVNTISNNLDIQNTAYLNNNTVLNVGGTFTYSSSGSSTLSDSIAVNAIVLSGGTLNDGDQSINVYGSGGWTRNTGGTFGVNNGTVYFTGSSNQTLGGTASSQTFNALCINKSSNTVTVGGSTTTLTLNGDMSLNGSVFDKGTATTINMTGGNWNNNGGSFTSGSGTVVFNGSVDQAIQGTASSETFNNLTVNTSSSKLAADGGILTLTLNGNMTLTGGEFDAGIADNIYMTAGNWTNNGATFTPSSSTITFNGTVAQAINGTAVSQTFQNLRTNKSSNTLSVSGSTTSLTMNGDKIISAGTFNAGTASTISVAGNWSMTGGSFTNTGSTVVMNGTGTQDMSSTGAFNNLQISNTPGYVNLSGNITVNGLLTFTDGLIQTNSNNLILGSSATTSGASANSYVYGNEKINIPNTSAPSRTFNIGDATTYAPVIVAFAGTTTGSGSVTAYTTAGDDADIANSGINSSKSVNRTWTLSNSGVTGFTSYSPTYTFTAGDIDAGATTSAFRVSRFNGTTWDTTTAGTRTSTATQCTGETLWGKAQVGEKNTLVIDVQPADTSFCTGMTVSLYSHSSSTPTPAVKWQRDPNTGTFADITGSMDGSIYSTYTTTTLNISNAVGLTNYKYRAVFSNINATTNSNNATLTVNTTPTITGTTPSSVCDLGTVTLGATSSAGTITWYDASSAGNTLTTGTSYTTATISSTHTFYVDATVSGCTTSSRTSVAATVYGTPTITGTTPGARCDAGTVSLSASASAGSVNWYAASSGGSSLATSTGYTTPSISTTTTYYVDAIANGCTTSSRTSLAATVSVTPTATIAYQSCAGADGNTTIRISQTGGTSPFTYKINSGTYNSTDTFHVGNGSTQNYYVKDTYGCTSSANNYTATSVVPTQIATTGSSTTCNCASAAEGRDVYLTNSSGDLLAVINDNGHDLGNITATVYTRPRPVLVANNQGGNDAAMGRSFVLHFAGTGLTPAVEVKFPFTTSELGALVTTSAATPIGSDDIFTAADLGSTQYEGPNEDSIYNTSAATMLVYHTQLGHGNILGGQYVKIGLTANGEHWLNGNNTNGSPLPVKLVSFEATANSTLEAVETKWTTDLEINNAYFTVERSDDAINFNEVSRVTGAGTHTGILDYRFTDLKPFNGVSYYRLKQTDFDGNYTYSDISAVTMGTQSSFRLYPNPTQNEMTIAIANPSDEVKVTIYDLSGRQMFAKVYTGQQANQKQLITLQAKYILPTGMYMVSVNTNGTEFKQKLILNY